jgi:hypothetical protein
MDIVWLVKDSLLLKGVNRNTDAGRVVRTLSRDSEEADQG